MLQFKVGILYLEVKLKSRLNT